MNSPGLVSNVDHVYKISSYSPLTLFAFATEIIHLDNNNFRGSIPANVWTKVTRLTELHLHNNDFVGELPSMMGMLKDMSKSIAVSFSSLCFRINRNSDQFILHLAVQNPSSLAKTNLMVPFQGS
jgi:hypothetical protein